jgi:hypothetical protein
MNCVICTENMTKKTRKEIHHTCCGFKCCMSCFRAFLMSNANEPSCMSCGDALTLEFIAINTPISFHNQEYRKHRTGIVLSQERSLLPTTQHLVENFLEYRKFDIELREIRNEEKKMCIRLREIKTRRLTIRREQEILTNTGNDTKVDKKRKAFVKGCSNGECRGFLSSAYKCGTCQQYACPDCHVTKNGRNDDTHMCDENTKLTVSLLAKETKPCPNCAVPIYKVSGCDQMWCIECKTPFSWKSGLVVTGVIHNPHYYQWQRAGNGGIAPRVAGDRPELRCGGLPWIETIELVLRARDHTFKNWRDCHRLVPHIRGVVMPRYPVLIGIEDHTDLRVKFLINDINEKCWFKTLQMRVKKHEKNREIHQLLELLTVTLTDLFTTYTNGTTNSLEKSAHNLRNYVNVELLKVKKRYNNTTPFISENWVCKYG